MIAGRAPWSNCEWQTELGSTLVIVLMVAAIMGIALPLLVAHRNYRLARYQVANIMITLSLVGVFATPALAWCLADHRVSVLPGYLAAVAMAMVAVVGRMSRVYYLNPMRAALRLRKLSFWIPSLAQGSIPVLPFGIFNHVRLILVAQGDYGAANAVGCAAFTFLLIVAWGFAAILGLEARYLRRALERVASTLASSSAGDIVTRMQRLTAECARLWLAERAMAAMCAIVAMVLVLIVTLWIVFGTVPLLSLVFFASLTVLETLVIVVAYLVFNPEPGAQRAATHSEREESDYYLDTRSCAEKYLPLYEYWKLRKQSNGTAAQTQQSEIGSLAVPQPPVFGAKGNKIVATGTSWHDGSVTTSLGPSQWHESDAAA